MTDIENIKINQTIIDLFISEIKDLRQKIVYEHNNMIRGGNSTIYDIRCGLKKIDDYIDQIITLKNNVKVQTDVINERVYDL